MSRVVAIVGRPNVGKSALFNRLAGRQVSLVYDRPGTTRDRIEADCSFNGIPFRLIDTGGIGLESSDSFGEAIAREADIALATASTILLVVDGREGLTALDLDVVRRLRRSPCPILVVVNKLDDPEKLAFRENEFSRLGFGDPLPVSAAHGHGVTDLMSALAKTWSEAGEAGEPESIEQSDRPVQVAIVGRPNVGKSSLVNALVASDRTIVSHIPGTTRDAVDITIQDGDDNYVLVDTAGMRQRRRIRDGLEEAMTGRSVHTINRADVCVLVIDAEKGVSLQDKKIAGMIDKAHSPCLIVVNKWDLLREQGDGGKAAERAYYEEIRSDLFFIPYASVLFLSAKTGERVKGLLKATRQIAKNRFYRFPTGQINRQISEIMEKHPPPRVNGKRLKIYYISQYFSKRKASRQVPALLLFVNSTACLTDTYKRYLESQIRNLYPLEGCPLLLLPRGKARKNAA